MPTYTPPVTAAITPTTAPQTPTSAKLTYTPLEPLPNANSNSYNSLSAYLNLVFTILLSLGAMIAVVTLVLAGITYMISEVVDKKSEARRRMQASIIGLLLLLTSWLILNTINPNLTKLCILNLDAQCGGTVPVASTAQPNATAPAVTSSSAAPQLAQQEANCKNQGTQYALTANEDGTFSCQNTTLVNASL